MRILLLLILAFVVGCSSETTITETPQEAMYFPPLSGDTWETKSLSELQWDPTAADALKEYLNQKHTKGFMILVNGRIVMEDYFNGHSATENWYWASAGKTLTSTMTGIAQEEGYILVNAKVSDYLGAGWTSAPIAKENAITCRHLLTMTSGLDDAFNDSAVPADHDCVEPSCLVYAADAGSRWGYDNVYVKLQEVVASQLPSGATWSTYFNTKLRDKIGMNGLWVQSNNNSVYWSTTRSMARFGLLALNNGKWNGQQLINSEFFSEATTSSQNINLAYGYLWWLNGKSSYHLPQSQLQLPGSIVPSGPADMFMALGKNDQKIYVIPSKKMVVVRMGDAADTQNAALSDFDEVLWQKIKALYE